MLISPSLLSADFANLERDVRSIINGSQADWLHCDIMDGQFVPNLSFGLPVLEAVKRVCTKPLDVHLMILNPDQYVQAFKDAGAHVLTVHYEACTHLDRTLSLIKSLGMKAGVSLNPSTPVEVLTDVAHLVDLVLVMSVNPGFGGQKFIPNALDKVRRAAELRDRRGGSYLIEVDGGVSIDNAASLAQAGADVLVAGNAVFKAPDPVDMIAQLKAVGSL
jgi:ribulose-phosphate 3-epimerase